MYPQRMVSQVLRLGLLVTLVVLVVSACGGGEKEAKARPLPEDQKALRPGEYRSEEFKPSLSFRIGKGWSTYTPEAPDILRIWWRGGTGGLSFTNIHEVFKPTRTGAPNVVEAPEDIVGWFRRHPYLDTTEPGPPR